MQAPAPRTLVLASTSPYRRELLARLALPFTTADPAVDEAPAAGEAPAALATRLAAAKARAVAAGAGDALVIGSDQVACIGGDIAAKPGSRERAIAQLERAAGGLLMLYTAVCVVDTRSGSASDALVPCTLAVRTLSRAAIEAYIDAEQPFDCAGSFRIEGLGISLFERVETDDPTAIVGLPLIATARLLRAAGVDPLR